MEGWVNIDLYDVDAAPTVLGSIMEMPFRSGVFERAYIGHVMEHLRYTDELQIMLLELRRVCAKGAEVVAVGPDVGKFNALYQQRNPAAPGWLLDAIVSLKPEGRDVNPGGWHQWVPIESMVLDAFRDAGYKGVEPIDITTIVRPEWPNPDPAPWQHCVKAIVP